MSWSLFNHNLPTGQFDPGGYPKGPVTVDAESVFGDSMVTQVNQTFQVNGMFCCDKEETKLMVVPKGHGWTRWSVDGGETFSGNRDLPGPDSIVNQDGSFVIQAQYHEETGDFWINNSSDGGNRDTFYWSDDDGVTWTRSIWPTSPVTSVVDRKHCFYIHPDGTLYFSTGIVSAWSLRRQPSPKVSDAVTSQSITYTNITAWAIVPLNGELVFTAGPQGQPGTRAYRTTLALGPEVQIESNAFPNGRIHAYSGDDAFFYKSADTAVGQLTLNHISPSFVRSDVVVEFGEACSAFNIGYGDGYYILTARRTSDPTQILALVAPEGDYTAWYGPYTVQLSGNQDDTGLYRNQISYWGNGTWLFGYRRFRPAPNGTQLYLVVDKFKIAGTADLPTYNETLLRQAIFRQTPDIFCLMDDAVGSISVRDVGRKRYANAVHGSLVFESPGLVQDKGTACLIDSEEDSAVVFNAVPTPSEHAHVFVLKHDGTAIVRTLTGSGSTGYSGVHATTAYMVVIGPDHKLGVWFYKPGSEEVIGKVYSAAPLSPDTVYLCAVSVSGGKATFYIQDAYDSRQNNITITIASSNILALGAWWTGIDGFNGVLCADGVTIDYYALIPIANFNYQLLVEANGGVYVPPTADEVIDVIPDPEDPEDPELPPVPNPAGLVFLCHFDADVIYQPNQVIDGRTVRRILNHAPGSTNRIITETKRNFPTYVAGISHFPGPGTKFGVSGFYVPPYNTPSQEFYSDNPLFYGSKWIFPYWEEGNHLEIGARDFTYDLWVRPWWQSIAGCNQALHKKGDKYYLYGGITIRPNVGSRFSMSGGPEKWFTIHIGCSLSQALAGGLDSIMMEYSITPSTGDVFKHVSVSRKNGKWHVFCEGRPATLRKVTRRHGQHEDTVSILRGGKWLIGAYPDALPGTSRQKAPALQSFPCIFDEARLIVGRAEYTEPFTPPTAPYNYG